MGDSKKPEGHGRDEKSGFLYTNAALVRLRETLARAAEVSWLHESLVVSALDTALPPPLAVHANPNCGAQAFRALFPRIGSAAEHAFEAVRRRGWMNRRTMEAALKQVGGCYRVVPRQMPRTGLALIEWTGTWHTEGFWGSDLKHTHWVALVEGFVYDINWEGWLPRRIWEDVVLDEVIAKLPGATGWRPHTGYELS